jgi:N-acylneuraminate cytidylyltransferase/CMP-N,N'-diacetyllegionaminic acid synthase
MVLQPTSPLRSVHDICAAMNLAFQRQADAVVSVSSAATHPYLCQRIDATGQLSSFLPVAQQDLRRQALPVVHAINGAIYFARCTTLRQTQSWYTPRTYAYIMPAERSLDIDTPWELHLADLILRHSSVPWQNRDHRPLLEDRRIESRAS